MVTVDTSRTAWRTSGAYAKTSKAPSYATGLTFSGSSGPSQPRSDSSSTTTSTTAPVLTQKTVTVSSPTPTLSSSSSSSKSQPTIVDTSSTRWGGVPSPEIAQPTSYATGLAFGGSSGPSKPRDDYVIKTGTVSVPTPRLSGLGIPDTPRMPGERTSVSEPSPGRAGDGSLAGSLGINFGTPYSGNILGANPYANIGTSNVKVETIIPTQTVVSKPVDQGLQSISQRVNVAEATKQVEQLNKEIEPLAKEYQNFVSTNLNDYKTQSLTDLSNTINIKSSQLVENQKTITDWETKLMNKQDSIDLSNKKEVDLFNSELVQYQIAAEKFNTKVDLYNADVGIYSSKLSEYQTNVDKAKQIYNEINTKSTIAGDIISNINQSLVPETIKVSTTPETKKYGPGVGMFNNPAGTWAGFSERAKSAGTAIVKGLEKGANPFPKDKIWGKVGNFIVSPPIRSDWINLPDTETKVINGQQMTVTRFGDNKMRVTEDTIHNPVTRSLVEFTANNPAAAAATYAIAPGFVGTVAKTAIVIPTLLSEGYRKSVENANTPLTLLSGVNEPLYSNKYTRAMDEEARSVLLGNIPQATLVPRPDKPGTVWAPGKAITEGVNLGFMNEERRQIGINALADYYKKQGLSNEEADYRISKVQDSLKISNQAEWIDLAAAGIGTNLIGAKGVSWAEKTVAPKITSGLKFMKGAEKIPIIGKGLSSLATKKGARYAATRILGMAPAGAVEGVYFTGAQVGGRYNAEMTPKLYAQGALMGGISAPLAQMFIEAPYFKTSMGGVIRPPWYRISTVSGKKITPVKLNIPSGREAILFGLDPLEPVSDAITQMLYGSGKGVRTSVLPFTNVNVNTNANTNTQVTPYSYTNVPVYTQTFTPNVKSLPLTKTFALTEYMNMQPSVFTQTSPLVNTKLNTNVNTYPLVNTDVYPLVNTQPNVPIQALVNVNPLVNTNPNVNVNPNVIVNDKFPIVGWLGGLGGGEGGSGGARKSREWTVSNKIATYGEDWMARQQLKAAIAEKGIKERQQTAFKVQPKPQVSISEFSQNYNIHPQGYAVVNRVLPINPMGLQMNHVHSYPVYVNEPNIKFNQGPTPRQRAQAAVERGFGKIVPLSSEKVSGLIKSKKGKKIPLR